MRMACLDARLLLAVTTLALGACDDDEGPDPGPLDAQVDSGKPDAHVDLDAKVDASLDASLECSLDQTYVFTTDGGLVAYRDTYTVSPAGKLTVTRGPDAPDAGALASCQIDLPACGSANVDASDLSRALHAPGVVAAFGDGSSAFGCDPRPVDGTVISIERADGKKILVGSSGASCAAVPADVAALRSLVNELIRFAAIGTDLDGGTPGTCILKSR